MYYVLAKSPGSKQSTWNQILALFLTSCVTLGKMLTLSGLQLSHLQNQNDCIINARKMLKPFLAHSKCSINISCYYYILMVCVSVCVCSRLTRSSLRTEDIPCSSLKAQSFKVLGLERKLKKKKIVN